MSFLNFWSFKKEPIPEPKFLIMKYFNYVTKKTTDKQQSANCIWYLAIIVCIFVAISTIWYMKRRSHTLREVRSAEPIIVNELNQNRRR